MFTRSRLFLLVGLAAVAASTTSASAASLRIEPAEMISAVSSGKVTFGEGEITIECELTISGGFSMGLLSKVAGTQIGGVGQVEIREEACVGGSIEENGILGTPWRILYQSILGTLPSAVTGFLAIIERLSFNLETLGGFINCLYSGNPGVLIAVTGRNPYTVGRIVTLPTRLPLVRGSFCPAFGSFNGRFTLGAPVQRITRL